MNYFTLLPTEYLFSLIREKLEEEPENPQLRELFEICIASYLIVPNRAQAQIAPHSEAGGKLLWQWAREYTPKLISWNLTDTAHKILENWLTIVFVDGGYRPLRRRSAWAVYDSKREKVYSGSGKILSSTDAEWEAALMGCRYAVQQLRSDERIVIFTDSLSIPTQVEVVDAQNAKRMKYAWKKYHNERFIELYGYLSNYLIDIFWSSRMKAGISKADQACGMRLEQSKVA